MFQGSVGIFLESHLVFDWRNGITPKKLRDAEERIENWHHSNPIPSMENSIFPYSDVPGGY